MHGRKERLIKEHQATKTNNHVETCGHFKTEGVSSLVVFNGPQQRAITTKPSTIPCEKVIRVEPLSESDH